MKNAYSITAAALALLIGAGLSAQVTQKPANAAMLKKMNAIMPAAAHHLAGTAKSGVAPPNDLCGSVTFEALAIGGSLTFTGDLTGATIDGDYEAGSAIETAALGSTPTLNSVWHGYTLSACADVVISYCGITPAFGDAWIVIGTACPVGDASIIFNSSWNTTDCADGNVTVYFTGLAAGNYYVPVMQDITLGADGPYSIDVSAAACPAAAANDECDNATSLTAAAWCNPITASNIGGTESLPALTCNGFTGDAGDDTWFSFVATATDMTIAVDGDGADLNVSFDAVVELFEGTCSALVSIGCADGTLGGELEVIEAFGLTVGNTYYVRVYHYYAADPDTPTFQICVVEGTGVNIGIEENATLEFSVFPNPGNGDFTIQLGSDAGMTTIELIDLRGRVAFTEVANLVSGQQHELHLAGQLAQGSYTLRLTSDKGTSEQGVMVR